MGLTAKQSAFCEEYLIDLNGTQAAIRAGYSPDSATSTASELLTYPNVRARIEILRGIRSQKTGIDAEYVIKSLQNVAERCQQQTPVMKWDYDAKAMMAVLDENGNAVYEFDSNGANKALELLGKHLGIFEADNKQKSQVISVNLMDDDEPNNR